MEVERQKMVDLFNKTKILMDKLQTYHNNMEKDASFFVLDRVRVELRLLYCDIRDMIISDPLLKIKFFEQIQTPLTNLSTILD